MGRLMTVSESIVIAAPQDEVYGRIADPTLTGGWSPENTGARSKDGAPPGALPEGAVFEGRNRRLGFAWTTECVVTAAVPGQRFAFDVRAWGVRKPFLRTPIASWSYDLAQAEGGTRVTETWTDNRRWPDVGAALFDRLATRGSTFADFNRRNIATTLRNLKAAIESEHG
jgi:hypothetical protein